MNTKKNLTEIMEEENLTITDLLEYLQVNEEMVRAAAKSKENEKVYGKIRLTPVSFSKISAFIQKAKSKLAAKKLEKQERKLATLKERIAEGAISKDQLARIAFKVAQLEEKLNALKYQSRVEGKVLNRALKIKKAMQEQIVLASDDLYYFEKNPFTPNEKSVNNQERSSIAEQLDQNLNEDVPNKTETLSMADQLDEELNKEVPPVTTTQAKEEKPISMAEQLDQNLRESSPVSEPAAMSASEVAPYDDQVQIDSEVYQSALDAKKRRIAEENHQLDNYLLNGAANTYHLKHDEIIQDRPTLTQDKEQLEQALSSLRDSASNDYIRREYQRDLDRVNELLRNSNTSRTENVSSHAMNAPVDASLTDLIKAAEEEERRAQELADQARLAKEEALQAAREKDEKQRMALETDERYRQLLQEAKVTIEARSQRARERAEQERLELARNRELVDGIRRDSQEIAAKVAQRQNDISQLESVLGQYKGDNTSRSSMR